MKLTANQYFLERESKHRLWILSLLLTVCFSLQLPAQVTMGGDTPPHDFSTLELISNRKLGLRMPLLTIQERNLMTNTSEFQAEKQELAKGLTIYNTTNNCLEFWSETKWIATCEGETPPYIPKTPDTNAGVSSCVPYMFDYQTMNLSASYTGVTPTSYQWVVDGKLVPGATNPTYVYTPPADIVLQDDGLGNMTKTVAITCQMEINNNESLR